MFDKFFSMFSHDMGIDLGTSNTLIYVRGKGIVIREPSVVAIHKRSKKIVAIGTEAKKMIGKTPASIITVRPLRGGVIADFDATTAMIAHYIQGVHEVGNVLPVRFAKPKVVIGIPSSVTEVERRAVWESALSSGARAAYLIEEPMAAAIGEGISVFAPTGVMVVDIGGGTTEIAIISLGGIVISKSLKVAGDDMDAAIIHYIRLRHGLLIGEKTAEDIKIAIGSAYETKSKIKNKISKMTDAQKEQMVEEGVEIASEKIGDKMAVIRGRDIETGLPKSLRVSEVEIREGLAPVLSQILQGITDVLEEAPPEMTSDILEHGILLTGGGSKLPGINHLIVDRTKIPVISSDDPLTSVARGTGKVLEDDALLERVKVVGGLR
ncbi:MAG: rod shape-determining protein [Candidatus Levyibacteriota bacterium]